MSATAKKKETYVTEDLLTELDVILEEKAETDELFDDFSDDLANMGPVDVIVFELSPEEKAAKDREDYMKRLRNDPQATLPDTVEK